MRINNLTYRKELARTKIGFPKKLYNFFYMTDLHSVLRYGRIMNKRIIDEHRLQKEDVKVIDIGGCLNFALAFLANFNAHISEYLLVIYDAKEYMQAKKDIEKTKFGNIIKIIQGDALIINEIVPQQKFDICLIIDVLEHIYDDKKVVDNIYNLLNNNGLLCISVPSHSYKRFFGENFHEKIGHIREGYTSEELQKLTENFNLKYFQYYTNLFNSILMTFFYKYMTQRSIFERFINIITFPLLKYLVLIIDKIPTKTNSSVIYFCEKD